MSAIMYLHGEDMPQMILLVLGVIVLVIWLVLSAITENDRKGK